MFFEDRIEAARLLFARLAQYKDRDCVVVAVPRGAVPMGVFLAQALACSFALAPVRKVASPLAPEFALGAADVEGNFYPDEDSLELPQEQLRIWFKKNLETLRQRFQRWRKVMPQVSLKNKTVIIVDDGVATGSTMRAALMWSRRKEPHEIIVAVPVASHEGLDLMHRFADAVICLEHPRLFNAVGEFYLRFDEVTDDDVLSILRGLSSGTRQTDLQP
jgi:predicted phosphoribosyltransferase